VRDAPSDAFLESLMRHANGNITTNIYTHAVSSKKRRTESKVVEMILPQEKTTLTNEYVRTYYSLYEQAIPSRRRSQRRP
jgi:hypothetical protein